MSSLPKPDPPLSRDDKSGRGFYNDSTGRLLCPVDYDWNDTTHRQNIHELHPDFLVSAQSWPTFLYAGYHFDPQEPSKGLFKGEILVKAFKAIFTSPTSADDIDNEEVVANSSRKRRRGERRTRPHVAALIGMKTVQPQAIAYVACQLRFALSSCGSWTVVDGIFNTDEFYNTIMEWFEGAEQEEDKKYVAELLLWWNRMVFGQAFAFQLERDKSSSMSVAQSLKRRRISSTR
ncbi:hypothetical protein HD554DRAFT_2241052 [Boletus coccyginus]|nr:hypothetical protein HD554DRAFT_2241052 [Boletus coccyginus]